MESTSQTAETSRRGLPGAYSSRPHRRRWITKSPCTTGGSSRSTENRRLPTSGESRSRPARRWGPITRESKSTMETTRSATTLSTSRYNKLPCRRDGAGGVDWALVPGSPGIDAGTGADDTVDWGSIHSRYGDFNSADPDMGAYGAPGRRCGWHKPGIDNPGSGSSGAGGSRF